MRAVDTNILVYAFVSDTKYHRQSLALLTELGESRIPWAVPWPCLHEFYGTVTRRKLFPAVRGSAAVRTQIEAWLESPSLTVISESRSHWSTLSRLLQTGDVIGPVVHDAKIAAICLDHGVDEFLTFDRDFSRFSELKVRTLLA
jgi:toxin-antitoxin system PIN domain toxin